MNTATAEYRAAIPRHVWMAARARNAMRRPMFIGTVSLCAFIVSLIAVVVTPRQAQRLARSLTPAPSEWPDTLPLLVQRGVAVGRLAAADSALTAARGNAAAIAAAAIDTAGPATQARRDSLSSAVASLDQLISRAENAPLATSYRALGESPELIGNARVRVLLDSLGEMEREREGFGAVGGVDPMFVALTSRATEIGRAIQALAVAKRDILKHEITTLTPLILTPTADQLAAADTTSRQGERVAAAAALQEATVRLDRARARASALAARAAKAEEMASVNAPPMALLGAAMVFGIALGFGVALFNELRRPRIADEHEAEYVSGIRVLSVIERRRATPERGRRQADRDAPQAIDRGNEGYQLVYLHAAASGSPLLVVTVTGEEGAVNAPVAANFAAIAAEEARTTLVVDTENTASPMSAALGTPSTPGFADLVSGARTWPEVTSAAVVGRDRAIDVVPSGSGAVPLEGEAVAALLRRDASRLARHYDAIILSAPVAHVLAGAAAALPVHDVIYCARVGHTRLGDLQRAVAAIGAAGGRVTGVVLWNGEPPRHEASRARATEPRGSTGAGALAGAAS